MKYRITAWLFSGETGTSSECIAATILGIKPSRTNTPSDPSDFCRCLKLIRAVPEIRGQLYKMSNVSKGWCNLIAHWKELEAQFMQEVPGWLDGKDWNIPATKTYKLMKGIGL